MSRDRVVVVGAGMGGLACAIELAAKGCEVQVVERASRSGGKMREVDVAGSAIDSGPTVFTMRWVFDALFDSAGASLDDYLRLTSLDILARHAWDGAAQRGERFDLFADSERSADAIAAFFGPEEARRFMAFCAEAKAIYRTLEQPFLAASRPGPLTLTYRIGARRLPDLFAIRPFETLWGALSKHFHDPRLRQLFGRYATYVGSSPFTAPATLMLIAHVEQDGVWTVAGGMQRLAEALERLAVARGVSFRFEEEVREILVERGAVAGIMLASGERIEAGSVVLNADSAALAAGLFGAAATSAGSATDPRRRSLSAITWSLLAKPGGFPLVRHNVFFSKDYAAEFDDLFKHRRMPHSPTVYVCAQERGGCDEPAAAETQRLFMLVNAPAIGDSHEFDEEEVAACETRALRILEGCGLTLQRDATATRITTPTEFNRLFPGRGGALYGEASQGWMASFRRPGANTRIPGLYLAGGSTHPGAGVPMAALSGRLAAQRLLADRASTPRFRRAAISGGTSMASATTDSMRSR